MQLIVKRAYELFYDLKVIGGMEDERGKRNPAALLFSILS